MNRAEQNSFTKNCKTEMRSLIPLPVKKGQYKRPNEKVTSETVSRIKKPSWDPEGPQPPEIPLEKIILLKNAEEKQKHIVENQHELWRRIELIKEQLKEVKVKIEKMTQDQQDINHAIEGCQDCGHLLKLANQKSVEHRNLMKCLEREDKLMEELQKAQREICEAGVAEQAFSLEMEKKIDGIYEMYHTRKDFLVRRRIRREKLSEKNARYAHKQVVKEVIQSLSSANKANQKKLQNAKILRAKTERSKMKRFFRKTMKERELQIRLLEADRESKLSNQQRLLGQLKTEMDRQKDVLWAEFQMRQKRKQNEEELKEAVKMEMLLSGENPYLNEKLLKNVDKNAKIKQKIEKETEEIKKLAQRLQEANLAKEKEELKRKKWDQIWAKRLKEKKARDLKKRKEMYGIAPKEMNIEEENEKEEEEAEKEKVVEETKIEEVKVPKEKIRKKGKSYISSRGSKSTIEQASNIHHRASALHWVDDVAENPEESPESVEEEDDERHHPSFPSAVQAVVAANMLQSGRTSVWSPDDDSSGKKSPRERRIKRRGTIIAVKTTDNNTVDGDHDRKKTSSDGERKKTSSDGERKKTSSDGERKKTSSDGDRKKTSSDGSSLESRPSENIEAEDIEDEETEEEESSEMLLEDISEMGDLAQNLGEEQSKLSKRKGKLKKRKKQKDLIVAHAGGDTGPPKEVQKPAEPCFKWQPETISFSDFEIGKTYKKKVQVRNIGYERIGFNFLEFIDLTPPPPPEVVKHSERHVSLASTNDPNGDPSSKSMQRRRSKHKSPHHNNGDTNTKPRLNKRQSEVRHVEVILPEKEPVITDLVKIDFTAPTPIFPGLQHTFMVTFQPTKLGDWFGKLKFEYAKGNFEIPLECHKKRFIPQLTPPRITFAKVVEGTSSKMIVKIGNIGAKIGAIQVIRNHADAKANLQEHNKGQHSSLEFSDGHSEKEDFHDKDENHTEEHSKHVDHSVQRLQSVMPPPMSRLNSVMPPQSPQLTPLNSATSQSQSLNSVTPQSSQPLSPLNSVTLQSQSVIPPNSVVPQPLLVQEGIPHPHDMTHHDLDSDLLDSDQAHSISRETTSAINISRKWRNGKNNKAKPEGHKSIVRGILDELLRNVTEPVFLAYCADNDRTLEKAQSRHICVHFRPPYVDSFHTTFEIQFTDSSEHILLEVEGHSVENPVVFDPMNTNMKICMIDHNYQQVVTVTHPMKGSGKVHATVPAPLKHYVSVYPKEVSVFNYQPSSFSVKFHPTLKLFEDLDVTEFYDKATGIIDFPVYFHLNFPLAVPSPVKTTYLAIVTDTRLQITPTYIELGKCTSAETVKYEISIYNPTIVAQHIAFVEIPEFITFQPNFGFLTILPFETRSVDLLVSITDNIVGEHTYHLKCQTLKRQQYIINVKIDCSPNSVQFSRSRIMFPATCCGSVITTTLDLVSTLPSIKSKSMSHKFLFKVGEGIPIEIRPPAGLLEPGQKITVIVSFKACIAKKDVLEHVIQRAEMEFMTKQGMLSLELENVMNSLQYELEMAALKEEEKLRAIETASQKKESVGSSPKASHAESNPKLHKNSKTKSAVHPPPRKTGKGEKSQAHHKKGTIPKEKSTHDEPPENRKKSKEKSIHEPEIAERQRSLSGASAQIIHLEARRDELLALLEEEFEPPDVETISNESAEYKRAELDLMRQINPASTLYTVPCYVYDSTGKVEILLLSIKCAMIRPDLVLLNESPLMDFGAVCLGNKVIKEYKFANVSGRTLKLKMDIFNPYGPFLQCNALRKMEANDIYTLRVRYKPTEYHESEECIFFFGGDSRIQLTMQGHSVIPQFYINPLKTDIYIGKIEAQSVGSYQFEVINPSEGDVEVVLELGSIGPFEGKLPMENSQEVNSFAPNPVLTPPNTAASNPTPAVSPHTKKRRDTKSSGKSSNPEEHSPSKMQERKGKSVHGKKHSGRRKTTISPNEDLLPDVPPPMTPPPFVGPFEITQNGFPKKMHLREVLSFLKSENQPVLFQAVPSKLTVKAMSTEKFIVYFIPVIHGRYFGGFKVVLFGNVVHEFNVIGVASRMRSYAEDSDGG